MPLPVLAPAHELAEEATEFDWSLASMCLTAPTPTEPATAIYKCRVRGEDGEWRKDISPPTHRYERTGNEAFEELIILLTAIVPTVEQATALGYPADVIAAISRLGVGGMILRDAWVVIHQGDEPQGEN